jgi:hypothetical protein
VEKKMFVYADQNFLIKCRDNADWRDVVITAHKSGKATLVLSPIHFYEIGTVREDLYERTIQFVEDVQPSWILYRADLQLQEFLYEWDRFWKLGNSKFNPVNDLAYVASAMHRKPRKKYLDLTPRDFIESFRNPASNQELLDVFKMNLIANDENRSRFKAGEMTPKILHEIEKRFVATQLARVTERGPYLQELHERVNELLITEPSFTQISIFVENGAVKRLRAYSVESLLTSDRWAGDAKQNENRQVDRDHAVVSLAYCDVFVTNDSELRKYCEQVRGTCAFPLAKVVGCEEWIEYLHTV